MLLQCNKNAVIFKKKQNQSLCALSSSSQFVASDKCHLDVLEN